MRPRPLAAGLVAAVALLAAACGGSSPSAAASSPSSSPPSGSSPSPAATGARVAVASNTKLGQILVDDKGITLYLFVADTSTSSMCFSQCATFWPPLLTTGAPQAGAGANQSLLGTTTRTDGKVEVTYAGHPLYYFLNDKSPGDTKGQGVNGFGGLWWVVTPAGAANTAK